MLNKVMAIGNVGADPEVRNFPEGGKVANFSLAVTEKWKDGDNNARERTEWMRVSVQAEGLVGIVEQYVKKGSKLYVEGKLETREYTDRDGIKRAVSEVCLRPYRGTIELLDAPAKPESNGKGRGAKREPKP